MDAHDGNDCGTILTIEEKLSARKVLEVFWILAKNPSINNRFGACQLEANFFISFLRPLERPVGDVRVPSYDCSSKIRDAVGWAKSSKI